MASGQIISSDCGAAIAGALNDWAAERDSFPGSVIAATRLSAPRAEPAVAARGRTDPKRPDAISPTHLFRWASVSKAATALAAIRLSERGVIDLDGPITAVLTRDEAALPARMPSPTPRQLLSHRGGVPDYFNRALDEALRGRAQRWTPSGLPTLAARSGEFSTPGSRFSYSDTGFVLVGLAMERRTGRGLGEVLRSEVLQPLEMLETCFEPDGLGPARACLSHHEMEGRDLTDLDLSFDWAGGGLVGPVHDLLRLAVATCTGSLVTPRGLEQMQALRSDVSFSNPQVVVYDEYGLGIGSLTVRGSGRPHLLVGATGCWGAFAWTCPELDVAVAGTVNAYGTDRRPLVARILDTLDVRWPR